MCLLSSSSSSSPSPSYHHHIVRLGCGVILLSTALDNSDFPFWVTGIADVWTLQVGPRSHPLSVALVRSSWEWFCENTVPIFTTIHIVGVISCAAPLLLLNCPRDSSRHVAEKYSTVSYSRGDCPILEQLLSCLSDAAYINALKEKFQTMPSFPLGSAF